MHPVPQGIANEGGSDHKTNQQDQYVDFNVSELNKSRPLPLQDQSLPRASQQKVKKIIQLEGSAEFLSNDQMPAQATKSEAIVIRASDQRLKSIIEIQDPQNVQNSQLAIGNPVNTTHKVTEKNTPRSAHNFINPPQKVKNPVSKIPLLITKDTTETI